MTPEPRPIDLATWPRREHFEWFRRFDDPFFNVCADVGVGRARAACREAGASFFLATLWSILRAVNAVEELKTRIRDDRVVLHDTIHGASTVMKPNDTFAFAYFDFLDDFPAFARGARTAIDAAIARGVALDAQEHRDDLVHSSALPWIAFTSISHARRIGYGGSTPRISFGKAHGAPGEERMPISVEVHHALADALHVGRFLDRLQAELDGFGTAVEGSQRDL